MPNTLQKTATPVYTIIPGVTIATWNPPITKTVVSYAYEENGEVIEIGFYPPGTTLNFQIPSNQIIVQTQDASGNFIGYKVYKPVVITREIRTEVTTPGFYSYETFPDTFSITYDNNIGWTGSAISVRILTGNGSAKFSPDKDITGGIVGFNEASGSNSSDYFGIDHAIYFSKGFYRVIERGVFKTDNIGSNTYLSSDVFTISRIGSKVYYLKNNSLIYTSLLPSSGDLILDSSLYAAGDIIANASIVTTTDITLRYSQLTSTSTLKATPKAKAKLTNEVSAISNNGVYSTGDEVHAAYTSLISTSKITLTKSIGSANLVATSLLKGTGSFKNDLNVSLGKMSARLTSGYFQYNSISSSFKSLTADVRSGQIATSVSLISSSFPAMTSRSTGISGVVGSIISSFRPMTALLSNRVYTEIKGSFKKMTSFSIEADRDTQNKVSIKDYLDFESKIKLKEFIQVLEYISILTSSPTRAITRNEIIEILSVLDILAVSFRDVISESIIVNNSISGLISKLEEVLENLIILGSSSSKAEVTNTIVNFISIIDNLSFGINLSISESLILNNTINNLYKALASLLESLILDNTLSVSAEIGVLLTGNLEFSNSISSIGIFRSLLQDSFVISIPTASGQDTYLAYLFSPETNYVTNYNNYNFDGCTKFNGKYLFYNKNGLYEYGGVLDEDKAIVSKFTTSANDFGTSNLKQIPSVYMGLSNNNTIILKVRVDGKAEVIYKLNKKTDNLSTRKIDVGKGLIGRYFQFEVITDASDFSLESLEFFPVEIRRKF